MPGYLLSTLGCAEETDGPIPNCPACLQFKDTSKVPSLAFLFGSQGMTVLQKLVSRLIVIDYPAIQDKISFEKLYADLVSGIKIR